MSQQALDLNLEHLDLRACELNQLSDATDLMKKIMVLDEAEGNNGRSIHIDQSTQVMVSLADILTNTV